MKKIENPKAIIATILIGAISISAATLYWQYKKLMSYKIKLKNFMLISFTESNFTIDLLLGFLNNSSLNFKIISQQYSVFINNQLVAKIGNNKVLDVVPGENNIPLRVAINPMAAVRKLNGWQGILLLALKSSATSVKIVVNLRVSLWFLKFDVPFTFEDSLKNMLAKKKEK
nr:hypothetical protein [uncultured Flavobacterium sp.]